MKKLFFFAAALLAAFTFSACSDNEDDGPTINTSKLLGEWVALARYDYDAKSDSYVEYDDKDHRPDILALNFQDEKTVLVSFYPSGGGYGMTYTLKGSKITFREEESGYEYYFTITDLTDTQMELWKKDIDDDFKVRYERKTAE